MEEVVVIISIREATYILTKAILPIQAMDKMKPQSLFLLRVSRKN